MMSRNVCLAAMLALSLSTGAAVITDNFDAAQNYAVDGTAGTIWDGFFYNVTNGNATVAAADANISATGVLTLRTTNGNWENGDNDGVLLYKTIEGDFDARIQVISMNNVNFHDAGLMARVADLSDAGPGEDWVAAKYYRPGNLNGHRSTDNNAGTTFNQPGGTGQPWLRLVRQANVISSYRSADGITWTLISTSNRSDMNGLALQVGIWQATFNANEGTAQFDNFSLQLPITWSNSGGGSWPTPGNWTNGVPSGAGDWIAFPGILSGNASVTLNGNQTAGRLTFSTTNSATYSIDSGSPVGTLTINDNIGINGILPGVDVYSGTHSITAPIVLSNGVTVTSAATAELKLLGGVSGNGGLIKDGIGKLTLITTPATYTGNTLVNQGSLSCLTLPAGIQASYAFNNPNNLGEDSSVNGNHLTTGVGAPAYAANGKIGGALYLNGGSTLVRTVFPQGVPVGSTPYTIALWEKSDGSPDKGGFIGWGNNVGNQCNNLRMDGNNRLINYWYGNDWILSGLSTNPKDGNWHHIAVTWNGSTQTMYVDGSPIASIPRTGLNAQASNFVIGKTTGDIAFKGWLDNVQVANRAFTAQEITALMQQSSTVENMLPASTSLQVASGAKVDLNGAAQTLAGLSGGGRVTTSSLAPSTLTVGNENSSVFSGTIDGYFAINKVGAGTLTLSGVKAYRGNTTVSGGTLLMSMPSVQGVLASSRIWFDASDGATLTTNATGVVTLWTNKGTAGAALNAVSIIEGVGPTVLPGALNNKPVLSLNNTNGLQTAGNAGISGAQDRTLFVVGCRKNNNIITFIHIGNEAPNKAFGIASQTLDCPAYTWANDISFAARANEVYEIYDYMIANKLSTANLISGEDVLSGSRAINPDTVDTPMYLGSRSATLGNGNLAEVILFDRALTQIERAGIEAYLRAKWFTGSSSSVLSLGAVTVAAGTVLDLSGTTQTLTTLSGSGLVTNGAMKVTEFIAPGGTNSVGTLRVADLTFQSGTLLTDVRTDGTCDLLEVEGALDLTGLSLQIADVSQLQTGTSYLIATCSPGELTGCFATANLGTGSWQVSCNTASGEVRLSACGTVIMIQ